MSAPHRTERYGLVIRKAIDAVLNGSVTGRFSIHQLVKTEKTYIGTAVERFFVEEYRLPDTEFLDTAIKGIPVDIKFTIGNNWMIPPEAIDHICVLIQANDDESTYSLGLLRIRDTLLCKGNRDTKCSLRAAAKRQITWCISDGALPPNFLLHLDDERRSAILTPKTGQKRVRELFRSVRGVPIPRLALATVASQFDPRARARDAGKALASEKIRVFSYRKNKELARLGLPELPRGYWIAYREDEMVGSD